MRIIVFLAYRRHNPSGLSPPLHRKILNILGTRQFKRVRFLLRQGKRRILYTEVLMRRLTQY